MEMNTIERLQAMTILKPLQGNIVTLRVVDRAMRVLSLKENELAEFDVKQDEKTGSVSWNDKGKAMREIPLNATAVSIIKDELKKLNDAGKLTLEMLGLAEKFEVVPKEEAKA